MPIQKDLGRLLEKHQHLKTGSSDVNVNINENIRLNNEIGYITAKVLPYFNIANLKSIAEVNKIIHLGVLAQNITTAVTGDGFAVNYKVSRLSDESYGIKSPLSICASHASAGTIRRLCTSQTMCQSNAKSLYENLSALFKHFTKSLKSSEMLLQALNNLQQHKVHLINWGSTRMSGYLEACLVASDTMTTGNI